MKETQTRPAWIRTKVPAEARFNKAMADVLNSTLCTVCVEAQCPNQMRCFQNGTATFLLLGPDCTRNCRFCAVHKKRVSPPDPLEPERIADAIRQLKLTYCVLTMVTRDDQADGGASHVKDTVEAIRRQSNDTKVELLISDLAGDLDALDLVLDSKPVVLNHNVETVPRLYGDVRPQANYRRSLKVISHTARNHASVVTKSGMMLGLGETEQEVRQVMKDLLDAGCRLLTMGQYLAPSKDHHPVVRYIPPEEFMAYESEARSMGFGGIASAPLVRSSYKANDLYAALGG